VFAVVSSPARSMVKMLPARSASLNVVPSASLAPIIDSIRLRGWVASFGFREILCLASRIKASIALWTSIR
jgi:hypothetical protein